MALYTFALYAVFSCMTLEMSEPTSIVIVKTHVTGRPKQGSTMRGRDRMGKGGQRGLGGRVGSDEHPYWAC